MEAQTRKPVEHKSGCPAMISVNAVRLTRAGIKLVGDPNYCVPADLAKSGLLEAVSGATEYASDEEADRWAAHQDLTGVMRSAINAVLEGRVRRTSAFRPLKTLCLILSTIPETMHISRTY